MPITKVLYVDGVLMPTPSHITPQYNRLWTQGSGRTISGEWHGDIQAEKWRLDVTWEYLSRDAVKQLMQALLTKAFIQVKFHSPKTDSLETITCYSGDVKLPVYSYALDQITYENFNVSIVER